MRSRLTALIVVVAALGSACSKGKESSVLAPAIAAGLPACGSSNGVFSVLPVDPARINGWVPLGNLNPPAHTFPTDHQYIYLTSASGVAATTDLLSPGDIFISLIKRTAYGGTTPDDYAVSFSPCQQLSAEFGHVRTITASILQAAGTFDQSCQSYSPAPGQNVTACYSKPVAIKVAAGAVIGTAAGLDLSLFDSRVTPIVFANPSRWNVNPSGFDRFHTVAFSDYYSEPARSTVRGMLGSFNGNPRRTVEPLGGTLSLDIAGTAQGDWFNASQPTFPESPHLAIVPANVTPSVIDISVGTSQPTLSANTFRMFPSTSGTANRSPAQITPGSTIYCWDIYQYFAATPFGVALVQLSDANTLTLELRQGSACGSSATWAFSANATFAYKR